MISAIVLAAGESRRMGKPKLLLPFGNTTIIGRIIDTLIEARVDEILVVAGHVVDALAHALQSKPVRVVVNPAYREGMLSSVRAGLREVHPETDAMLLVLGDQPSIQVSWIEALVHSHHQRGGGIHVPIFQGRRGHPLLIDASFRDDILNGFDDVGLRGLLYAHPAAVHEVPLPDPGVLDDIDTPDDYARAIDADAHATPKEPL